MKVRIKFQKTGNLRFIGHLDVMRYFQKLFRRAKLDIKFSSGYSPHMLMSFATPLGTGLTSIGEYVDVEFQSLSQNRFDTSRPEEPLTSESLIRLLNSVNVPDLTILDAKMLPDDAKNAMSLLDAADYLVRFKEGKAPENIDAFYDGLFAFMDRASIPVTKKTKTGTKEVDLKQQVRYMERGEDALFIRLDTGSVSNCKPEFVIQCYLEEIGETFDPFMFDIVRLELYGKENGELLALCDYGTAF